MSKKLILAEKPSVGKDIAKALGVNTQKNGYFENGSYIVTWAMGHLVTLKDPDGYNEKYKNWELEHLPIIPGHMKLTLIPQTSKQFKTIKGLLTQVNEVIIATDAGREGELVARWILDYAKNTHPIKRLWISSVTNKAITDGFKNLKDGKAYVNLYHSAVARATADWLVGINGTRALTTKFNASLSLGRVQTPTLSIIHTRDLEIRNFRPQEYETLHFLAQGVKFSYNERIFDKTKSNSLTENLNKSKAQVTEVASNLKKAHVTGYDLTTLQQDANRLFGFSASMTLDLCQKLYERHKVLTYPRTDSKYITSDMVETLTDRLHAVNFGSYAPFVSNLLRSKKLNTKGFVNDARVTDHHAIIPTEEAIDFSELSNHERKIYDLVVKKFLALLSPAYEYERTNITLDIGGYKFTASGNRTITKGYKAIYDKSNIEEEDEESGQSSDLPLFKKGDTLTGTFKQQAGKTTPPPYFTEGTLLMAMENPSAYMEQKDKALASTLKETGGLGTVATRADIIEKLFSSGLIEPTEKYLRITQKGRQLLELVPAELKSPTLTAKWETSLNQIAKGELKREKFISDIEIYTKKIINEIKQSESNYRHDNLTNHKCPDCGKNMLEIKGKKGKYLVCQDRNCGHRKTLETTTNARCPKCHKKLKLTGPKEKQMFVCVCGHKEKMETFKERKKEQGNKMTKKDVAKYLNKNQKEEKDSVNSSIANQLQGLKF